MRWASMLAIYFILWWLVLFAVLPWGSTSPHEMGSESDAGHAPSAPLKPRLLLKFAITTVVSLLLFALFYWLFTSGPISLDDIPFLPRFRSG